MMEVMKHPQTEALGMLLDVPDLPMRLMGLPLRFDGERPAVRNAAPSLVQTLKLYCRETPHSITSSARASRVGGTVRPSALAAA